VQQRARRHGNAGIDGNRGKVKSATYRIYEILSGSNPTLSANSRSFVFKNLVGVAGSPRATRATFRLDFRLRDAQEMASLKHAGASCRPSPPIRTLRPALPTLICHKT
jgi:hypothetical protein